MPAASQQPSHLAQELVDVKSLLHTAEQHNSELADQLKTANSSVEHYRVVVLTLEESLKKEKEVCFYSFKKHLYTSASVQNLRKKIKNECCHLARVLSHSRHTRSHKLSSCAYITSVYKLPKISEGIFLNNF